MNQIAVIQTGGKQYIVEEGSVLNIEKIIADVDAEIKLPILLLSDKEASTFDVGSPLINAHVLAKVLSHGKADKVSVIKYKPKVRYRRNVGHRQPYTKIKIEKMSV